MNLGKVWRKLRWSLEKRGWRQSVVFAWSALRRRSGPEPPPTPAPPHPFDLAHGTDTGGVLWGGDMDLDSANSKYITGYVGVPPSRLQAALQLWKEHLGPDEDIREFTFLDLGCGKGRALLLASRWPFREVRGVEINPALAQVADRNVERWHAAGIAVCPLSVVVGDAAAGLLPEGPLLIFTYNPFAPAVTRALLQQLAVRGHGRCDLIWQTEEPNSPLPHEPRLEVLWRGALAMSEEDAGADPASSPGDVTALYRWRG